ncbi:hypothetical protein DL765_009005 [Monosporascus sp. GIB2]|nr:hypothetical protein DL765_009005 [Monosporascus sp. GIB2]
MTTVEFRELPQKAQKTISRLEEDLASRTYQRLGELEICYDTSLVDIGKSLLDYVPDQFKHDRDIRITAIHFISETMVPVKRGSPALLIPFNIKPGAKVADQELRDLQCIHLNDEVPAHPEFHALLLLTGG